MIYTQVKFNGLFGDEIWIQNLLTQVICHSKMHIWFDPLKYAYYCKKQFFKILLSIQTVN